MPSHQIAAAPPVAPPLAWHRSFSAKATVFTRPSKVPKLPPMTARKRNRSISGPSSDRSYKSGAPLSGNDNTYGTPRSQRTTRSVSSLPALDTPKTTRPVVPTSRTAPWTLTELRTTDVDGLAGVLPESSLLSPATHSPRLGSLRRAVTQRNAVRHLARSLHDARTQGGDGNVVTLAKSQTPSVLSAAAQAAAEASSTLRGSAAARAALRRASTGSLSSVCSIESVDSCASLESVASSAVTEHSFSLDR